MSDYTDDDYEADMADADSLEERRQRSYAAWLRGPEGTPLPSDRAGDDAPARPRFAQTYCSQCGCELGPGDAGVSSCGDHRKAPAPDALDAVREAA